MNIISMGDCMNKKIYVSNDGTIQKCKVIIDDFKLLSILKKADSYYQSKGPVKTTLDPFHIIINNKNKVIEIVDIKQNTLDRSLSVYTYEYYEYEPTKLSLLSRNIINSKGKLNTSYKLKELLSYIPQTENEGIIKKNILDCFNYIVLDTNDLRKLIINFIMVIDDYNDVDLKFTDDEKIINNIPSIYQLKNN